MDDIDRRGRERMREKFGGNKGRERRQRIGRDIKTDEEERESEKYWKGKRERKRKKLEERGGGCAKNGEN